MKNLKKISDLVGRVMMRFDDLTGNFLHISMLIMLCIYMRRAVQIASSCFSSSGSVVRTWSIHIDVLSLLISTVTVVSLFFYRLICLDQQDLEMKKGLPEPLEEPIEADHGDTIEEVVEALRTEKLEYSGLFSTDGRKLGETTLLSPVKTRLSDTLFVESRKRECVHIHCHPGVISTCFSSQDLANAVDIPRNKYLVVSGAYTFVLEAKNQFKANRCSREEVYDYNEQWYSVRKTILPFGLSLLTSHQVFTWYTILATFFTARKFGFKLTVYNTRITRMKRFLRNFVRRTVADAALRLATLAVVCVTAAGWYNNQEAADAAEVDATYYRVTSMISGRESIEPEIDVDDYTVDISTGYRVASLQEIAESWNDGVVEGF